MNSNIDQRQYIYEVMDRKLRNGNENEDKDVDAKSLDPAVSFDVHRIRTLPSPNAVLETAQNAYRIKHNQNYNWTSPIMVMCEVFTTTQLTL